MCRISDLPVPYKPATLYIWKSKDVTVLTKNSKWYQSSFASGRLRRNGLRKGRADWGSWKARRPFGLDPISSLVPRQEMACCSSRGNCTVRARERRKDQFVLPKSKVTYWAVWRSLAWSGKNHMDILRTWENLLCFEYWVSISERKERLSMKRSPLYATTAESNL